MSTLPLFSISELRDDYIQKNFERLLTHLRQESPLLGFKHFSLVFHSSVTNYKLRHGLGFLPKDVWVTLAKNGVVTLNYGNFTDTEIDLTVSVTTDPCEIRLFAGSYVESP